MPINTYIIPILHTYIGIGNRLLKSFLDWVDLRIENVPDDKIVARYRVYETKAEVRKHNKIWDAWLNLKGGQLTDLREERAMINDYTKTL
jgi:hypothetical protein